MHMDRCSGGSASGRWSTMASRSKSNTGPVELGAEAVRRGHGKAGLETEAPDERLTGDAAPENTHTMTERLIGT